MTTTLLERLQQALGGAYAIDRELGGGGMSRVFTATERSLDRTVVLKVLPPELAQALSTDRFRQEIRLAARLQHLHIVPLLSAGEADGLLYYTMPFVEGESLRTRLAREGELPVRAAVKLLTEVAEALAYAHEHGVVHRDIKPDNVLLSGGHAQVADFGVAKALSAAATGESSGLTSLGMALGTPAYMAPEQAAADPHVDHRADLYAWGCLAYECLTGSPPFVGRSTAALLAAQATEAPESILRRRPSLPPSLASLVMCCLEKRPADRPQRAAELLTALEGAVTPSGGTTPTVPVAPAVPRASDQLRTAAEFRGALAPPQYSPGRRASRRRLAGVAAGVLLFLGGAALLMRREDPGTLDSNLLAVAPFDVLGSGLSLWREGLVDLLSRNLDGAGPIRTVSPSVVVNRWSGRADPTSAAELGRRSGAGLTVFGSLVGVGSDSFRLDAALLDVNRGRVLGEVRLRGHVRHMDVLADSLAVSLLRELGRTKDIAAVRTASLKASSLPALKAFLEGEQLYRRGSWDSAQGAYQRALALDSTLVPALRHLGLSISWRAVGNNDFIPYLLRAGQLNHGLPRRDSLLVAADSFTAALWDYGEMAPASRRELSSRLFRTLEEGTRAYPEDPEVWYALGEARMHMGWMTLVTQGEALEAFDRSIALDSTFSPAYAHSTHLGLTLSGLPGWNRYTRPYLALGPSDSYADHIRLLNAVLNASTPEQSKRADSLIRATRADGILAAIFSAWQYPDSAETGLRLARVLVAAPAQSRGFAQDPRVRRLVLAAVLGYRGHLRESLELLGEEERISFIGSWPAEIAMVAPESAGGIDARLQRWLHRGPLWPRGEGVTAGAPGPLLYALPWWSGRRDTASLKTFARRADSAQRVSTKPINKEVEQYGVQSASAYVALATGDTTTALRRFEALPHDVFWGALDRVTEGRILARQGRSEDALRLLERAFPLDWQGPVFVLTTLERGALAEKLGQTDLALTSYQFVADVWRHADPELMPYVNQARQGLARLTSEASR